ncbi:hypothetical protein LOTGIDRAFT_153161 [Lottia gigantea]|uniref:Major facilitator superfamily (MFS) profile domain-containing protein n=1 Tax=Lottia gigantea TaxID=225164 RepID=V4AEW5_LOTGI|nr:hypothetical protein LOTGIDRAFT_153161 [Lottia gigantea]ESO93705.1 hypothetical protein LOTGIDRAFT_153161 [Lottia gigantea]
MEDVNDRDEGWAWIVLLAACMNILLGSGLAFIGGMFQAVFLEQFKESVAYTAWVTALFSSLLQLTGPLASLVANYLSCRSSVMIGSALLSFGLILSSFANNIAVLMVTLGVTAGIGLGMTYTPSIVITNYYFHKKRNVMTGVVMAAAGGGIFISPLLTRYLLDVYSWRETLVIFAGVSIQMCIFGALMFPLHEKPKESCITSNLPCIKTGSEDDSGSTENKPVFNPLVKENGDSKPAGSLEHIKQSNPLLKPQNDFSFTDSSNSFVSRKSKWKNSNCSILFNSQLFLSDHKSLHSIQNTGDESNLGTNLVDSNKSDFLWSKPFLAICFNLFLTNAMYGGIFIHYPLWCQTQGATESEVSFFLAFHGPGVAISRLLVGMFANVRNIDYLSIYGGLRMFGGVLICLIPLYGYSQTIGATVMIITALYIAGLDSLNAGVTIDCVGLDQLASALGVEMVCAGLGYLVMPPIVGSIVDMTGTYQYTMYMSGGVVIAASIVCFSIPLLKPRGSPIIGYHPEHGPIEIQIENTV